MEKHEHGGAGDGEAARASASCAAGSAVAEISTGPENRKENGILQAAGEEQEDGEPAMSSASSQAARSGSSRLVMPKRSRSTTLSQAERAMTARQAQNGTSKSRPYMDDQHRCDLADDREPAQAHKGIEAHAAHADGDVARGVRLPA